MHLQCYAGGRGGGRAWGGDLIVFAGPGIGHLTDLALPGRRYIRFFLRPTLRYFLLDLTANSDEKD